MKTRFRQIITALAVATVAGASVSAGAEVSCAKDMFFDQLDSPSLPINTGLKYWIQLRRKGKTTLVDNRTTFVCGDEIRFLVIANIDGYAYVVLSKGSTGEEKVLFPNSFEPSGKITAGRQYALPAKGYLVFDKNAGTESVRLVVSRKPVSAAALLDRNNPNWVKVEGAMPADQPVQTANSLLAFGPAEGKSIEIKASRDKSTEAPASPEKPSGEQFSKDLNYVPALRAARRRTAGANRTPGARRSATRGKGKPATATAPPPVERRGSVTIVNSNPAENLIADIKLVHK